MKIRPLYCEYGAFVIQQRYVLVFMTFLAIVNCYNCRMCLYMSLTEIVAQRKPKDTGNHRESCPGNIHSSEIEGGKYNWSEWENQAVLLSFYPGYLIMHVPAGIIADIHGGRHVLATGVLVSAIITSLTPIMIQTLNVYWVALSRFLLGLAQAGLYPSITALLARWIPSHQRSELGSMVYSGLLVGVITGTLFTGLVIEHFKYWPIIFYVWSVFCFIWYIVFLFTCYSDPDTHPYVTEKERDLLDNEFGHRHHFKTPWIAIFKDRGVWAIIAAQFGHDWITYGIEMHMPQYFKNVLKYPIDKNAKIMSLPFIAMWICSTLSGYLSDYLINNQKFQVVTMRIIYTTIASVGPSIFLLATTYMQCRAAAVISLFTIALFTMGPYYAGLKVNALDLSLNFSGVLIGLSNGIGVFAGIITPCIVGLLDPQQVIKDWQNVFWISFGMCTATNIIYILWAEGDRCPWDHEPEIRT